MNEAMISCSADLGRASYHFIYFLAQGGYERLGDIIFLNYSHDQFLIINVLQL